MGRCVFVNLNVGSAIEQSGNEVLHYIKQIENLEVVKYTYQTREDHTFDFLLKSKPDIIIINGEYPRITVPCIYYKLIYPKTKIVFISRVISSFYKNDSLQDEKNSVFEIQRNEIFYDMCDLIICVNSCGRFGTHVPDLSEKAIDCCGLNDTNRFKITKEWKDRKKDFIMIGSLNEHKFSPKFLKMLNVDVDCYGHINQDHMKKIIEENDKIHYKGFVEFEGVSDIFNEYKYSIFPHNGYEPFCNTLQQSILCGTIPIVLDDNEKNCFGDYWLHWGKDLYIPAKSEEELNKIVESKINNSEDEYLSMKLREDIINKYDLNNTFVKIKQCVEKMNISRGFKWDSVEQL